jgi:hypothetical protein
VDGRAAPLVVANHALRGVPVAGGSHTVRFDFAPVAVNVGLMVTLLALPLLGLWLRP